MLTHLASGYKSRIKRTATSFSCQPKPTLLIYCLAFRYHLVPILTSRSWAHNMFSNLCLITTTWLTSCEDCTQRNPLHTLPSAELLFPEPNTISTVVIKGQVKGLLVQLLAESSWKSSQNHVVLTTCPPCSKALLSKVLRLTNHTKPRISTTEKTWRQRLLFPWYI